MVTARGLGKGDNREALERLGGDRDICRIDESCEWGLSTVGGDGLLPLLLSSSSFPSTKLFLVFVFKYSYFIFPYIIFDQIYVYTCIGTAEMTMEEQKSVVWAGEPLVNP